MAALLQSVHGRTSSQQYRPVSSLARSRAPWHASASAARPRWAVGLTSARSVSIRCSIYNSCTDRHCPQCSGARRAHWLDKAGELLLPGVDLLPSRVYRAGQALVADAGQSARSCIGVLMHAAWESLRESARAELGCRRRRCWCCTPGTSGWSIIRTCMPWCPAAARRWTASAGSLAG